MGTHAGFDKASGCGCGCGSGSALGLGLLRAVAWLVGAPSTPCSRGANHTYYSLLTTHYSLITMLRASANTLEMPSASTCVVRRRCDRLCEIGDVGGASDRLSIGLHCGLRDPSMTVTDHARLPSSSASARAPPSHRFPTLPLPGRRGRGRLEPRVASSVAAVSTAMSVAQHMCWRELGADGRRDDGVRREDPVQASEDDRLHLLAARLMHLWCVLLVG